MPDTGSGYGGKHNGDAALEAARLAKAVGKPVKRNWTREEELTWAYFRPGGLIEVSGKVTPDGTISRGNSTTTIRDRPAFIALRGPARRRVGAGGVAPAPGLVSRPRRHSEPFRPRKLYG